MDELHSQAKSSISGTVFKTVDGFKDGKSFKFSIQEITEDRFEDVLQHMCTYFVADEPLLSSLENNLRNIKPLSLQRFIHEEAIVKRIDSLKHVAFENFMMIPLIRCFLIDVIDDPLALEDFRNLLLLVLSRGLSVGAFLENSNDKSSPSKLVAVNNLYLSGEETEHLYNQFLETRKSDKIVKVAKAMDETSACVDIKKIYGPDEYLTSLGLSTEPYFRGMSLAYHLLIARDEIGKKYGIPATVTVFTNPISAKVAERAGFTLLSEKLSDDIVDENGKILIPNRKSKYLKCMGKKLINQ